MVGRPNIPNEIKAANGTLRKSRINHKAPKSEGKVPPNPFDSGTFAHQKWKEITGGLRDKGIVDKIDAAHLQGFCRAWQTAVQADQLIDERGILIDTEHGPKKNPAVTASKDAWAMVRQFAGDLGLFHLSRQRLIATPASDEPPKRMRRNRYGVEKLMTDDEHLEERYLS